MIAEPEVRELVSDVFEEEALVIGGLIATHHFEDKVVWSLVRSLDVIRKRALARVSDAAKPVAGSPSTPSDDEKPHPAIEEFLRRIREDAS